MVGVAVVVVADGNLTRATGGAVTGVVVVVVVAVTGEANA